MAIRTILILIFAGFLGINSKVAAQNTKPIYHAVDSVAISGNRGLKLYVAGNDSTTFKRIFGYLYDNAADYGMKKRTVDLLVYEPQKNRALVAWRDEKGNCFDWTPSPEIEKFLKGQGKNQAGETVRMAFDSNITIEGVDP